MAWPNLGTVKTVLGISGTSEDTRLDMLITQACAAVRKYCGKDFDQTTYPWSPLDGVGDSGLYDGTGTPDIVLRQKPVSAVTSVWVDSSGRYGENPDGAFPSTTLLTYGTDYVIRWDGCLPGSSTPCSYAGILTRVNGVWPARRQWVRGQICSTRATGLGNVKVAYTAGYPDIPSDLAMAVCELVAFARRNINKGGSMTNESLGAYSYTMATAVAGSFPELLSARQLMASYRSIPI